MKNYSRLLYPIQFQILTPEVTIVKSSCFFWYFIIMFLSNMSHGFDLTVLDIIS